MKFVFFSVSENGENGLGDEGADYDGDSAQVPFQNFWARTAAEQHNLLDCCIAASVWLYRS